MMNNKYRRILSMILTVIMIVGILPISAFADSSSTVLDSVADTVQNEIGDATSAGESNATSVGTTSSKSITLTVGDTAVLSGTNDGRNQNWTNNNTDIVSVTTSSGSNANIYATKPGTATVIYEYVTGGLVLTKQEHTEKFNITVQPKVSTINYNMYYGDSVSVKETDFYNVGTGSVSKFSLVVENENIAKYENGKFTALGVGTTTYTVAVESNGQNGTASGTITVSPAIVMPAYIEKYEGQLFEGTAETSDIASATYSFEIISGSDVASVSNEGKAYTIKALKPGTATLRSSIIVNGTAYSVDKTTITVNSNAKINTEASVTAYAGFSKELTATVENLSTDGTQYSTDNLQWTITADKTTLASTKGNTVTLNAGSSEDTAKVQATVGYTSETITVNVKKPTFGIVGDTANLVVGGNTTTVQIQANISDTGDRTSVMEQLKNGGTIKWQSNNTKVATVDENGVITPVAKGEAEISATVEYKGITYEVTNVCTVTVTSNSKGILFLEDNQVVQGSETIELEVPDGGSVSAFAYVERNDPDSETAAPAISFSSDSETAVVSSEAVKVGPYSNGYKFTINGNGEGTAKITATAEDLSAVATIKVVSNIKNISAAVGDCTLAIGSAKNVIGTTNSIVSVEYIDNNGKKIGTENGYSVTIESSDSNVASVDEKGVLHAVAEGEAVITVSVAGKTYEYTVTVKGYVVSIKTDPSSIELDCEIEENKTKNLSDITVVEYKDSNGETQKAALSDSACPQTIKDNITWESKNSDIAEVDSKTGIVTAKASGYATISYSIEGNTQLISVVVKENGELPKQGESETYFLTMHYVFGSGNRKGQKAEDDIILSYQEGDKVENEVVTSPTVIGYAPSQATYTFSCERITSDLEYTIYYYPSTTSFTVEYYYENINDNNVSSYVINNSETKTVTATTEDSVSKYTSEINKNVNGYIRTAYNQSQLVAADGSTVVAVYYNRTNVLVSLALNGGTGTDPIYGIWGSKVSVSTPTKQGYTFDGWEYVSGDNNVFSEGDNTAIIPKTTSKYSAKWIANEGTKYTVIYLTEKADSSDYDYFYQKTLTGKTGELTSAELLSSSELSSAKLSLTGFHAYGESSYDGETDATKIRNNAKNSALIKGDESTVVYVYYNRNIYTVKFYEGSSSSGGDGSQGGPGENKNNTSNQSSSLGTLIDDYTITGKYMAEVATLTPSWPGGYWLSWNSESNQWNTSTWQSNLLYLDGDYKFKKVTQQNTVKAYYYVETIGDGSDETVEYTDSSKITYKYHHEDEGQSGAQVTKEDKYSLGEGYTLNTSLSTSNGDSYGGAKFYYNRNSFDLKLYDGTSLLATESVKYEYALDKVKIGDSYLSSYEPAKKAGYTFVGWYADPECEKLPVDLTNETMPSHSLALYAKWQPTTVKLTVYSESITGGSVTFTDIPRGSIISEVVDVDSSWSVSSDAAKEFIGFYKMSGNTKQNGFTFDSAIYEDTVVKAFFRDDKEYNVVINYVSEDGTKLAETYTDTIFGGDGRTYDAKVIPVDDGSFMWLPKSNSHSILADPKYTGDTEVVYADGTFTYTFVYTQKAKIGYTVVCKAGDTILYSEAKSATKSIVTETAPTLKDYPDYSPIEQTKTFRLSSNEEDNVIVFNYILGDGINAYVQVTHYKQDASTGEYYPVEDDTRKYLKAIGTVYSSEDVASLTNTYSGYEYNKSKTEENLGDGKVTANGLAINIYYSVAQVEYSVIYQFKAYGTDKFVINEEIKETETAYGKDGLTVTIEAPAISGWTLSATTNSKQTITLDSRKENNSVTFNYYESVATIKYSVKGGAPASSLSKTQEIINTHTGNASGSIASDVTGYSFIGWYSDANCQNLVSTVKNFVPSKTDGVYVTATYYALYELVESHEVSYSFSWDSNGSTETKPADAKQYEDALPATASYVRGKTYTVPASITTAISVKDEYDNVIGAWSFQGWTVNGEAITSGSHTMESDDVSVVGTWKYSPTKDVYKFAVKYSVNGSPAGYSVPDSITDVPKNKTIQIADTPSIAGYTFSGWTATGETSKKTVAISVNESTKKNEITMPGENVVISGSFTVNSYPYTIKYVCGDDVAWTVTENGKYGETVTVTPVAKDGWTLAETGEKSIVIGTGTNEITVKCYKNVTVTADNQSWKYGDTEPTYTYTVTPDTDITVNIGRTAGDNNNVGTHDIVFLDSNGNQIESEIQNDKYNVTYVKGTLTVTKGDGLTVTAPTSYKGEFDNKEHGDKATPSVSDGTTISYSTDGGKTWSTEVPKIKDAGTITVKVKAENPNYETAISEYTLTVTRKAVTVKANDLSKKYGEDDKVLTATVTGVVSGDSYAVNYSLERVKGEAVGEYTITPTGDAVQGNYDITYETGTFTISASAKLTLTIPADNSYNGPYDGNTHGKAVEPSIKDGTTVEYSIDDGKTWTTTPPTIKDVGTITVKVRATNPNYLPSDEGTYTLTVTQKDVTVTAVDTSKVYGAADPEFTANVVGTVGTDTVKYSISRENGDDVGDYTITPSGEESQGNYKVSYVTGKFTITEKDDIRFNNLDKNNGYNGTYDGQSHGKAATTNITDGSVTIYYSTDGGNTWSTDYPTITNVGTTEVQVKAEKENYKTATGSYTLTVTPKDVTVNAVDSYKLYGESDPTLTATVTGLVDGESETLINYSVSRVAGEKLGTYAINVTAAESQGNYKVATTAGKFDIRKGVLTLTIPDGNNYNGVFDNNPHGEPVIPNVTDGTTVKYSTDGGNTWTETPPTQKDIGTLEVIVRAENENYEPAESTYKIIVNAAPVTVKADDKSKKYGDAEAVLTATVKGVVSGDSFAINYSLDRADGEDVGEYTITPSGKTEQGNYTVSYETGVYTISVSQKLTLDITDGTNYNAPYDGNKHGDAVVPSVVDGTTVEYSTDGGETWTTTPPTIKDVGTITVKVRATNPNYLPSDEGTYTLTVTQKDVTVTAVDTSKVYGAADPALTANVVGTVGTDTVKYSISREEGENVKDYTITPAGDESQGNYKVSYKTGTFTITEKDDIRFNNLDNNNGYTGIYDGQSHGKAATTNITDGSVTISYSTDGGNTWSTDYPTITNVGTTEVQVKAEKENYKTVTGSYTLKVTQKDVVINVNDSYKLYGESDPTLTATVTGLVEGESEELIKYSISRVAGEDRGTYAINATVDNNGDQGNYNVTSNPGKFEIRKGVLTLTIPDGNNYNGVFDNNPHGEPVTPNVTEGTTVSYSTDGGKTWTETPPTQKDIGTLEVIVKAENSNYEPVKGTYKIIVTPAQVTVTANDLQKVYGEADPTLTATAEGVVIGDTYKVLYRVKRAEGENVGTYKITPYGDKSQGNYEVSFVEGTFTITSAGQLQLTDIAKNTYSGAYDGQTHGTAVVPNITEGTTVKYSIDGGVTWSETVPTIKNVGKVTVLVEATNPNYEAGTGSYTLEVTPAAVTVTAENKVKVYNTADPTFTVTVEGEVNNEKASYTSLTRDPGEDVGKYTINVSGEKTQNNGNYSVTFVNGELEITKDTIIFDNLDTKNGYNGVYDGQYHGNAANTNVSGTTITYRYSTDGGNTWSDWTSTYPQIKDVGTIKVQVKAQKANYEDATGEYTLVVTPKEVTITIDDKSKMYGDTDPELTAKVSGVIDDGIELTYTLNRVSGEDAGEYAITATIENPVQGNYKLTAVPGKFFIAVNKGLRVVIPEENNYDAPYDGNTHGSEVTANVPEGTTISYSTDGGTTWTDKYPTIKDVGVVNVTVKAENPNYVTATGNYTLKVTQKSVTLKAEDKTKKYGEADPEFTVTADGVIGDDTVAYTTLTRAAGNNAGTYDITPAGTASQGNYYVTFANGTLTIAKRSLKLTSVSYERAYDGTDLIAATVEVAEDCDGFAANEGATYTVTGKQKLVGESENTFDVSWKAGTNADNYEVEKVYGTLKVTGKKIDGTKEAVAKDIPEIGEKLYFTITVTNTSAEVSDKIVLTEQDGCLFEIADGEDAQTLEIESLEPGETRTVKAYHVVTAADIEAGTYDNTVNIKGNGEDINVSGSGTPAAINAKLTMTKTVTKKPLILTVGAEIEYTITVTNSGNVDLKNVTVTDELTGISGDNAIVYDVLPAGESRVIDTKYVVKEEDVATGVANTASVVADEVEIPGKDPIKPEDSVTTDTIKVEELSNEIEITKEVVSPADGSKPDLNEFIEYKITVTNKSQGTISSFTVSDPMLGINNLPINKELKSGESYSLTRSYKVTAQDVLRGYVVNAATVSAPDPTDPTKTIKNQTETPKLDTADIDTTMTVNKTVKSVPADGKASLGEKVTFIIEVTNSGNVPFTNVKVVDEMLGWTEENPYIIKEIGPKSTVKIPEADTTYTVTSDDIIRGSIVNIATAEADTIPDPHDPDNPKTPEDTSDPTPPIDTDPIDSTISMTKVVKEKDNPLTVGSKITYTITVTNNGNVDVHNILVKDELTGLEETIPVIKAISGATKNSWSKDTTYTITEEDLLKGGVVNKATAEGKIIDPDDPTKEIERPDDNKPKDEAETPEDKTESVRATFEITKTVKSQTHTPLQAGDTITYSITVKNTGNVEYKNVVVDDTLAGVTKVNPEKWTIASLKPTDPAVELEATYVVTADDILAGGVTNTVTAKADKLVDKDGKDILDPDGKPIVPEGEKTADKVPTESINRAITINKSIKNPPETVKCGETLTYVITVTNNGNVPYYNAVVKDEMLNLNETIAEIQPGKTSAAIEATYTVTAEDILAGKVTNIASVQADPIKEPTDDPDKPIEPEDPIYKDRTPYDDNKDDPTEIPTESVKGNMELTKGVDENQEISEEDKNGYKLGSTIHYVITIKNTGNAPFSDIHVVDEKAGYDKWLKVGLGVGETTPVLVDYVVTEADILRGYAVNEATVTAKIVDDAGKEYEVEKKVKSPGKDASGDGSEKVADLDTTIQVDKVVTSQTHTPLQSGDTINYKITVTNKGNVTLKNVVVTDPLTGLNKEIGELPVNGKPVEITTSYKVTAADILNGGVTNEATVTAQKVTDPKTEEPVDPEGKGTCGPVNTEDIVSKLEIEKSLDEKYDNVNVGDEISYTIKVTNKGNVPYTNVEVTDELTGLSKTIKTLEPKQEVLISTDYTVTEDDIVSGTIYNVAKAEADEIKNPHYDPNKPEDENNPKTYKPEDSTEPVGPVDTVEANPKLELKKELLTELDEAKEGDVLSYKITVTNAGNVKLSNVIVEDALTGKITKYDELSSGVSKTIFTRYTVTDEDILNGNVINTATGDAEFIKDNEVVKKLHEETSSEPQVTEEAAPAYKFTKTVDKTAKVKVGDVLTYTLTVENTGNVPLKNITVKDEMTGFEKTLDVLHAGDVYSWPTKYTVSAADLNNGTLTNTASIDIPDDGDNPKPKKQDDPSVTIDLTKELKVIYRYEDGTDVRDAEIFRVVPGETYSYPIQELNGYHTAYSSLTGVMGEYDTAIVVTYYKNATTNTNTNTGNNNNTTKTTEKDEYDLVIHYIFEDGRKAADDYTDEIQEGKTYLVRSPEIDGYEPSVKYVYSKAMSGDTEVTVTYKQTVEETVTTDNTGDTGETWGEANGYTIEDIEESAVPLAIRDSNKDDCLVHLLLMVLALTAQVYYINKKKKLDDEIYELEQKVITLE